MKDMGTGRSQKVGLVILAAFLLVVSIVVGFIGGRWIFGGSNQAGTVCLALAVMVSGLIVAGEWAANFRDDRWVICSVTGKDRGGEDGSYRIYTQECGVLGNQDAWLRGKFDSASVWTKIQPGNSYTFHIAGSRIPLFSMFPNVFEVKKAKIYKIDIRLD